MKMFTILFGSYLIVGLAAVPTHAQVTRQIPARIAQGDGQLVTIDLYRGHGVTLNFRPTDERIQRAWLDDPSQVTLDFDDVNCSVVGEAVPCAATVIHLRRIERLDFPNLPATDTTLVTVLTEQSLYQFRLAFPTSGIPSYFVLEIQPNASQSGVTMTQIHVDDIQQIEQGLRVALSQGWVAEGDRLWSRVQTFLTLMRNGVSASDAASQAGISNALVIRLNELGQSPTVLES
jgi:hypothetical protein